MKHHPILHFVEPASETFFLLVSTWSDGSEEVQRVPSNADARRKLVMDIAGGEYDHLSQILECEIGGQITDATKELAEEVMTYVIRETDMEPTWIRPWLELTLGVLRVERELIENGLQEIA